MESTRIAKLEELLARVRANAALGHPPRAANARATSTPEGAVGEAWAARGIVETVDDEISEIDRTALRVSLERHVELALGDETPGVPFAEETEGWEPDRLELEDDDGPRLLRAREAEVPLVTAFPTQPAPPPSMVPAALAEPPPAAIAAPPSGPPPAPSRPADEDEDDDLDEEPLYPAGLHSSPDMQESVLGEVLARAARHADGEIDPRAIWDGVAGQLRGRRASSSAIQIPRVGGAVPRQEAAEKGTTLPSMPSVRLPERSVQIGLEIAGPAKPSEPPEHADSTPLAHQPTPTAPDLAAMPAALSTPPPRASRPSLELDVDNDTPPDLDFDDEPDAATSSDLRRRRIAAPTSRPSPSSRGRSMRPPAPGLEVAALRAIDDLHDGADDARPSRKRLMRTGRHHRPAPRRERRRPWLWILAALGVGAATALALAFALGKIGPTSVPGSPATTAAPVRTTPGTTATAVDLPSLATTPPPPTAPTTAAPVGSLVSPTLAPPGAPATDELKADEGYLRVDGDPSLAVYLNGNLAGQATEWIRTTCGIRHLRLARRDPPQPGASFPKWLDAGNSLVIPCRGATVVAAPTAP